MEEVLTKIKEIEKENGTFEEGTVNYLVEQELDRLAQSWNQYASRREENKTEEKNNVK